MTTLQSVISELTGFWHEQGCAVLPPCSSEVPLGLLHPEAFFRLLDPEPWQAAFLQPISRPADARGGEHPYRVARHLQFQVVWKGLDARQPRDLMLESLARVGFDLEQHDLRFVDERLNVEAAEIRGRGWRVLLDGLRLARISFLDRIASEAPVESSVEISYGVELLAMARGETADIFSVPWRWSAEETASSQNAADLAQPSRAKRRESEQELHAYALDVASVSYLRQAIDGLDREASRCVEAGLPRVAYEQAMRMLPLLDLLETRGDLSFQERAHWLGEVRARVLEAAAAYRTAVPTPSPESTASLSPALPSSAAKATETPESGPQSTHASGTDATPTEPSPAELQDDASPVAPAEEESPKASDRKRRRRKKRASKDADGGT